MPRNTRESVWGRVDQHETDECWPFVGAVNTYGYGQIRVDGKQELAHRLAFELATGISPGLLLGRRFGVTAENISSVCRRLTWRHV
jgi:hypothetical protein